MIDYKKITLVISLVLIAGTVYGVDVHAQKTTEEPAALLQEENDSIQDSTGVDNVEIKYARSTVDRLNVRTHPDLQSSVITLIGKTHRYEVLDEEDEWVKIRLLDGSEGWIFKEYVAYEHSERDEVIDATLNQATVVHIVHVTNLRNGPGTDHDIVGKAKPGETFPIVDVEGDWYIVALPDQSKVYVASWVVETDFLSRNANVISSANHEDAELAPHVYIYHTHNKESWSNVARNTKGSSVDDPEVNITLVGKRLAQLLNERDIPALSGDDDFSEKLKEQRLGFSQSYKVSRQAVNQAREAYPSLSYFFDIHRDANVPREKTTITIDGKVYARVLFVIGTAHSGYKENLAFAEALNELLNAKYPGLSRGILTKSKHQGDGEYNQSISPGSLLLEFGGTNNTLQESFHTAEAIAYVFAEYYKSVNEIR